MLTLIICIHIAFASLPENPKKYTEPPPPISEQVRQTKRKKISKTVEQVLIQKAEASFGCHTARTDFKQGQGNLKSAQKANKDISSAQKQMQDAINRAVHHGILHQQATLLIAGATLQLRMLESSGDHHTNWFSEPLAQADHQLFTRPSLTAPQEFPAEFSLCP